MPSQELVDRSNSFRILLATDIHLGYKEQDPHRANDSFETFEEILQIAKEQVGRGRKDDCKLKLCTFASHFL